MTASTKSQRITKKTPPQFPCWAYTKHHPSGKLWILFESKVPLDPSYTHFTPAEYVVVDAVGVVKDTTRFPSEDAARKWMHHLTEWHSRSRFSVELLAAPTLVPDAPQEVPDETLKSPPGRDNIPLNHPRRIARIAHSGWSLASESPEVQKLCADFREKESARLATLQAPVANPVSPAPSKETIAREAVEEIYGSTHPDKSAEKHILPYRRRAENIILRALERAGEAKGALTALVLKWRDDSEQLYDQRDRMDIHDHVKRDRLEARGNAFKTCALELSNALAVTPPASVDAGTPKKHPNHPCHWWPNVIPEDATEDEIEVIYQIGGDHSKLNGMTWQQHRENMRACAKHLRSLK